MYYGTMHKPLTICHPQPPPQIITDINAQGKNSKGRGGAADTRVIPILYARCGRPAPNTTRPADRSCLLFRLPFPTHSSPPPPPSPLTSILPPSRRQVLSARASCRLCQLAARPAAARRRWRVQPCTRAPLERRVARTPRPRGGTAARRRPTQYPYTNPSDPPARL
jgi:hypothetical protein